MAHFKLANPKKISDRDFWVTISILAALLFLVVLSEIKKGYTPPYGYLCSDKEGIQNYIGKRQRPYCRRVTLPHP